MAMSDLCLLRSHQRPTQPITSLLSIAVPNLEFVWKVTVKVLERNQKYKGGRSRSEQCVGQICRQFLGLTDASPGFTLRISFTSPMM